MSDRGSQYTAREFPGGAGEFGHQTERQPNGHPDFDNAATRASSPFSMARHTVRGDEPAVDNDSALRHKTEASGPVGSIQGVTNPLFRGNGLMSEQREHYEQVSASVWGRPRRLDRRSRTLSLQRRARWSPWSCGRPARQWQRWSHCWAGICGEPRVGAAVRRRGAGLGGLVQHPHASRRAGRPSGPGAGDVVLCAVLCLLHGQLVPASVLTASAGSGWVDSHSLRHRAQRAVPPAPAPRTARDRRDRHGLHGRRPGAAGGARRAPAPGRSERRDVHPASPRRPVGGLHTGGQGRGPRERPGQGGGPCGRTRRTAAAAA